MRTTIRDLSALKKRSEPIPMITAYDYTSARVVDAAGVPLVLVGDSLGQVVLGYDSTVPVTMDDIVHHTRPVVRGAQNAHIVADMPFMSYQTGLPDALRNAARLLREGGAHSVKLEGGSRVAATVRSLVEAGIPVMGHTGFTPQSVNQLGASVQGKTADAAVGLLNDATALEEAGCYAVVLELVPAELAQIITERLTIPTIGIGAGPHCDGQVLVFHDLLGLYTDRDFKHSRRYASLADDATSAVSEYVADIKQGNFPSAEESHAMDGTALEQVKTQLAAGAQKG